MSEALPPGAAKGWSEEDLRELCPAAFLPPLPPK
jgi:hypothetical protein